MCSMELDIAKEKADKMFFQDKLMANNQLPIMTSLNLDLSQLVDMQDKVIPLTGADNFIPLIAEDKSCIYLPWQKELIIKVL
ncbi:hypothetical protein HAX54_050408, partial [Datura stramonium]|nr:hypothetical protein [Datura stramonium]